MKTLSVELKLYELRELNEKARLKALSEHFNFLVEALNTDDISNEDIIESIEVNEYLFYQDGEMADITHYCGNHKKAGITELNFYGDIYNIQ